MNRSNIGKLPKEKREGPAIEYKLCRYGLSKDIWETVSAFSNEGGGILAGHKPTKPDTNPTFAMVTPHVTPQVTPQVEKEGAETPYRLQAHYARYFWWKT